MNRKEANIIIVGGTIASGKSSLVERIAKEKKLNYVSELRPNDQLQDIILKKLYQGKRLSNAFTELYFVTNRYLQYNQFFNSPNLTILDRGIWEDFIFSKLLLIGSDQKYFPIFQKHLKKTIDKILYKFGYPKAYIFLKVDWKKFKERIYARGRDAEIANFAKNKSYFRQLLIEYNLNFVSVLRSYKIEPIIIETTNLNTDQVYNKIEKKLKNKNII